jgi:uncharacterized protein YbgA (DUF1722 family)
MSEENYRELGRIAAEQTAHEASGVELLFSAVVFCLIGMGKNPADDGEFFVRRNGMPP